MYPVFYYPELLSVYLGNTTRFVALFLGCDRGRTCLCVQLLSALRYERQVTICKLSRRVYIYAMSLSFVMGVLSAAAIHEIREYWP